MSQKSKKIIGIIGGSGLYNLAEVEITKRHKVETPYGFPSDEIVEGSWKGETIFFLPRHGKDHSLLPGEIPYRSNIFAFKKLGVTHLISISAVGIMKEDIRPGDLVIPDQFIDQTKSRGNQTFFGNGLVSHLTFAKPINQDFAKFVFDCARDVVPHTHLGGTYICIEGPRFSSRAESLYFRRTMDPSVIGMTALPEACLAKEAGISYCLLACGTDYDSWHEDEDQHVNVDAMLAILKNNVNNSQKILLNVLQRILEMPENIDGPPQLITRAQSIPDKTKELMSVFYENGL